MRMTKMQKTDKHQEMERVQSKWNTHTLLSLREHKLVQLLGTVLFLIAKTGNYSSIRQQWNGSINCEFIQQNTSQKLE